MRASAHVIRDEPCGVEPPSEQNEQWIVWRTDAVKVMALLSL